MPETYVVSDVHGCHDELQSLLALMEVSDEDTLINCGDAIDRGPKIKEVADFFIKRPNTINIIGNHELLFIEAVEKGPFYRGIDTYIHNGTKESFEQFGDKKKYYANQFKTWKPYYLSEDGLYVFCHATWPWKGEEFIDWYHPWSRWYYDAYDFIDYSRNYKGPLMIHGHTPCFEDKYIHEKATDGRLLSINLDKGCCYGMPESGLRGLRMSDLKIFEVPFVNNFSE